MITPRQVFDAWRDNDLFGFDPPEEGETYRQYRARVGEEALASDRLFHFVLAELCNEDLSVEETDRRLLRAIEDMETVRAALNRSDDSDGKVETSQAVLGKGVREKTNMLYDVSVSRIQTATKDIRVEADSAEEAEAKALERAGDEDFGGCVVEYDFDVNGAVPVDGGEEDDGEQREDEEPSPDLASEEKRCPDLGDGTCALCPTPFPGVSDETIDAGWIPSYFIGEEEQSGPVCPRCAEQFIVYDPKDGEATLVVDGEYVSVWDGGVEVRTKCVFDTHTREIHIEASQDANVEVLDREYVLLNGKEYKACNEEEWATYAPEEQARMFFWK